MKAYNTKNISEGLQEAAYKIKGQDITTIAALEQLDPSTVRNYLKGKVTTPAIGKAILDRCRAMIIEKEQAAA